MNSPRIEISKHLLFVNATSSVFRKVLSLAVLVWLQQYLLRRIPTEEYQLLPVLTALIVFFPLVSTMFASGVRRYVTEAFARDDEEHVTRLVSTMLPLLVGIAGLLLGIGLFGAWHIDALIEVDPAYVEEARWMFALLILGATLRIALAPLGLGFDLRQRFLLRNAIGLGAELLRTLLLLALLAFSTRVLWVVVANTVATLVELAVVTRVSMGMVESLRFRRQSVTPSAARPLLGFGGWSVVNQLAFLVREAADPLLLNRLSSEASVASFHVGSLVDKHVRTTFLQANQASLPVVTAMHATGQKDRLRSAYLRISRISLWILGLLAAPLVVFREELFALYLQEKAAELWAAPIVMGLLLARIVVIFPNSILGMVAVAKAEVRAVAWRGALVSAVNLALTIHLVGQRDMGAVGSALATFVVTIVGAPLLNWTLGLRLTGTSWATWLRSTVGPGLVPLVCALPVWVFWHQRFGASSWLQLALASAAGAAIYGVALLAFAMSADERAQLRGYVERRLRRS